MENYNKRKKIIGNAYRKKKKIISLNKTIYKSKSNSSINHLPKISITNDVIIAKKVNKKRKNQ
jgi:predicted SprT family Zn-dependent metalloprotease